MNVEDSRLFGVERRSLFHKINIGGRSGLLGEGRLLCGVTGWGRSGLLNERAIAR
ncbi:MAG: hypothetical protein AB4042_21665 [Leptolyngbyaceae cyanobacterium]